MDDMTDASPAVHQAAAQAAPQAVPGTRIDVVSDVICPWCYIGKAQLERALAALAQEGLTYDVHWNPFQLNPDMPPEGRDRSAYRAWKFGSIEKSQELDKHVSDTAATVGLGFRTDLMTRTPNTMAAHRLIWFAGRAGLQTQMVDRLFQAYFTEGKDIGDHAILTACAAEIGLPHDDVAAFLASDVADQQLRQADQAAREAGVNGVPSFFLDGYSLFSGAMPAEQMVQALRQGRQILQERAAQPAS